MAQSLALTVVGNLVADPELRFTPSGSAVASFSVAVTERYRDAEGKYVEGATSFVRCSAWRLLAEHLAESLRKGQRVVVAGVLRQRQFETTEGEKRSAWELTAEDVGPSLMYATATPVRAARQAAATPSAGAAALADDPWQTAGV